MKRIGLITLHRWFNYGSMLQAYAMNRLLNEMGYACELIDYTPPKIDNNRSYKLYNDLEELSELRDKYKKEIDERKECFCRFMNRYVCGSRVYHSDEELYRNPPEYDIYVTGSDQIWNVNMRVASDAYFLSFTDTAEKYAFAASIGRCRADKLKPYAGFLQKYKRIYMREEEGAELIRNMTGMDCVSTMPDPTLLLPGEDWREIAGSAAMDGEYIACYATLDDELISMLPILEELHKRYDARIVLFGMVTPVEKNWIENIVAAGPEEFIRIIRDAKLVLTHSFHGTAFSINLNTPFLTYNDNLENPRKEGILKLFRLEHRIVHSVCDIDKALQTDIDFDCVNEILKSERADAIKEIRKCLGD